jgi:hypothetical protein
MLKAANNNYPIDLLSVVQDDEDAKGKLLVNQSKLSKVIKHGATTQTKIQVLNRVDLNLSNCVARVVKERSSTDVILQWQEKSGSTRDFLVSTLFGTSTQNIVDTVWESLYICRFVHPINTTRKIVLMLIRDAQYEVGFRHWLKKMTLLSKQAGAPLMICGTEETNLAVQQELKSTRATIETNYKIFDDMDDLDVIYKDVSDDDLLVVVTARKGTLSYQSYMDAIQEKLLKNYPSNNFVLLYPEQTRVEFLETGMQSEDISLSPIQEQIDNLNRLGKAMKKILNPGSHRPSEQGDDVQN